MESPKLHATANDIELPLVISSIVFAGKPSVQAFLKPCNSAYPRH